MTDTRLAAGSIELRPLAPAVAAALPHDRTTAERLLGATIPTSWPQPDLLDILPMLAATDPGAERFGAWVMVERATNTVVGDIGCLGPPVDGAVEIGFSVIPERRRRRYASAAAAAIVTWILSQSEAPKVVARSDADNIGSIGVLERAGFRRTGEADCQISWTFAPSPGTANAGGARPRRHESA